MLEFRGREFKIILAVLILSGSFLFLGDVKNAAAYLNSYEKLYNGTLTAEEWNNLKLDFLNKDGGATMTGPLGIGTGTPSLGLEVNGPIKATSFVGAMTGFVAAENVMGGNGSSFGLNSGGGNYSFPGNLGIGTTNPTNSLSIYNSNNPSNGTILQIGQDYGAKTSLDFGTTADDNGYVFLDSIKTSSTWGDTIFNRYGGNVGIGSTNLPGARLDVGGSFRAGSATISTLTNGIVMADALGNLYATSSVVASGLPAPTGLNGQTLRSDGTNWIANSLLYNDGTNIGIGTTAPLANLHVISPSTSQPALYLQGQKPWIKQQVERISGGYEFPMYDLYALNQTTNLSSHIGRIGAYGNMNSGETPPSLTYLYFGGASTTTYLDNTFRLYPDKVAYFDGNVGVGTTAPEVKLDVNGAFRSTSATVSTLINGIVMADALGNLYATSSVVASGLPAPTGLSGQTLRSDGTSWIANSLLFNDGTNVGIGTISPGAKLDVQGNYSKFSTNGAAGTYLGWTTDTAWGGSANSWNGYLGFNAYRSDGEAKDLYHLQNVYTGMWVIDGGRISDGFKILYHQSTGVGSSGDPYTLAEAMRINYSGNVGIGTTNPGVRLDVNGAFRSTSATISTIGAGLIMADSSGNLFSTSTAVATGIPNPTTNGQTLRANGTNWVANSLLFNDGTNVGIGTSSPGAKLDVNGGINLAPSNWLTFGNSGPAGAPGGFVWNLTNDAASMYVAEVAPDQTDYVFKMADNANGDRFVWWIDEWQGPSYDVYPMVLAGDYGNFYGGRLYINNNTGNVGIGTTAPSAKLDVSGAFRSSSATISTIGAGLIMADSSGNLFSTSTAVATGIPNPTTNGQTLRANGTNWVANSLLFNDGTNVGIGTTAPGEKLDVLGNIKLGQSGVSAGSAVQSFVQKFYGNFWRPTFGPTTEQVGTIYGIPTASNVSDTPPVSRLTLQAAASGGAMVDVLSALGTGNVGIGTTNPTVKLDVNGALRSTSATISTIGAGIIMADSSGNLFSTSTSVATGIPSPSGISGQTLRSNGTNWIANNLLFNDGTSVGIGTTAPQVTLDINGALKYGDTADTCDVSHSGAVKYNSTSGQSYLCDGKRWINQKNCGLMTDDAGQTYGTVQIGGQCFMAENINIGTMLASGATEPTITDNTIQKWCYNNDPAQCTSNGGLYNWDEAMRGSQVAGARGICPSGWHIPSDAEYNQLEKTILGIIASPNSQYACDLSVTGWQRCADNSGTDAGGTYGAGKSLKAIGQGVGNGAGDDLIGFNGKLVGYRSAAGGYTGQGSDIYLWSSTINGTLNAWHRILSVSYSTIYRIANPQTNGFSIRCAKD